jgi:predicted acylesterase/phospholipase RssA
VVPTLVAESLLNLLLSKQPSEPSQPSPLLQQISRAPVAYLNNLIMNRGLFPGFAPRTFFRRMLTRYLDQRMLEAAGGRAFGVVHGSETIGFSTLFELTGVDLVITGTNVTRGRPAMFSRRLTPDFPVVDAVTISMSLPVVFKPALVAAPGAGDCIQQQSGGISRVLG